VILGIGKQNQSRRFGVGQRSQHDRLNHAENRAIGANAKRESDHGDGRESRALA
jgi:hypothetical protein